MKSRILIPFYINDIKIIQGKTVMLKLVKFSPVEHRNSDSGKERN